MPSRCRGPRPAPDVRRARSGRAAPARSPRAVPRGHRTDGAIEVTLRARQLDRDDGGQRARQQGGGAPRQARRRFGVARGRRSPRQGCAAGGQRPDRHGRKLPVPVDARVDRPGHRPRREGRPRRAFRATDGPGEPDQRDAEGHQQQREPRPAELPEDLEVQRVAVLDVEQRLAWARCAVQTRRKVPAPLPCAGARGRRPATPSTTGRGRGSTVLSRRLRAGCPLFSRGPGRSRRAASLTRRARAGPQARATAATPPATAAPTIRRAAGGAGGRDGVVEEGRRQADEREPGPCGSTRARSALVDRRRRRRVRRREQVGPERRVDGDRDRRPDASTAPTSPAAAPRRVDQQAERGGRDAPRE